MTDLPLAPDGADWRRLDPRMMLILPVREFIRFLPALLAVLVAGTATGAELWQGLFIVVPIAVGLARYLTTSYRISAGRIELRRGLLTRHVLSTSIDRVRTVDLTSSPFHRLLGLTTVRVGTGTGSTSEDERLDLDGLPVEQARALRKDLLRASTADDVVIKGDGEAAVPAETVVLSFDPRWVRYAPLTGSGLVISAAALGALSQLLEIAGFWDGFNPQRVEIAGPDVPPLVLIALGAIAAVVLVSLLAVAGYVVTNYGFRLTHTRSAKGAAWHLTRGLLTTRETTLDDERVAGISFSEPIGLRAAKGARLSAIVTGLDRSQQGSSALAPPAPRDVVQHAARAVLGAEGPVDAELTPHGPAAIRRRWVRALVPALVISGGAVAAVVAGAPVGVLAALVVLPLACLLAADRVRSLGHTLVQDHLVSRSGSMTRRRRALAVEHVIGWNFSASWFQRRAGLTTLVATTAGGSQAVPVLDIPEDLAVDLAGTALPDLVSQFRA